MGWVFTFQELKFSRILFYDTPAAALETVGLRE
jgi:hypothetical protein